MILALVIDCFTWTLLYYWTLFAQDRRWRCFPEPQSRHSARRSLVLSSPHTPTRRSHRHAHSTRSARWRIKQCCVTGRRIVSRPKWFDYSRLRGCGYLVMTVQSCRTLSSRRTPLSGLLLTIWPLWRQWTAVILSTRAAVQWNGSLSPLNTIWGSEGKRNRVCSSKGPSGKCRNTHIHPSWLSSSCRQQDEEKYSLYFIYILKMYYKSVYLLWVIIK